jgi:predicted ATPase
MSETFITHIQVKQVRNVSDLDIPLSEHERKHLIITGKNGSGKTSLLDAISHSFPTPPPIPFPAPHCVGTVLDTEKINIQFNYIDQGSNIFADPNSAFVIFSFAAQRKVEFSPPQSIQKIDLDTALLQRASLSRHFMQHIVNLKAERSFAKDEGDDQSAQAIDHWFLRFESRLKELFDAKDLELIFDRKNYNFLIKLEDQAPFGLSDLSAGYSAVVQIIAEIMLRMEAARSSAYDVQGIVLIDEIETHLHVELQKKILPFLCDFFPKIQFIVSTHSPFVLSSVENAVICDLQNRMVTEDLSGYSYDTLIESYFRSDKYSDVLKRKVARYEALADMPEKSDRELDDYHTLKHELSSLPKYLAPELEVKLQQIALRHLS